MNSTASITIPVSGRTCGDCAMCCKIPVIPELNKPYNTWCQHCSTRAGCDAYDARPERCREYHCHFILSDLGEQWRPSKCRIMLSAHPGLLLAFVDPARPDAWRKEPYFSTLTHWSTQVAVQVMVGPTTFAVFPDHVDNLGEVTDAHQIMTLEEQTPQGPRKRALRVLKSEMPADMQVGVAYPLPPTS